MDIAKAYAEDVSRSFCSSAGKVLRECQLIEIEQRNLRQSGTATYVYDFLVDMSAPGEGVSNVPAWLARRLTCPPGKILAEHYVEPRGMRSSASAVRYLDEHFPKTSAVLEGFNMETPDNLHVCVRGGAVLSSLIEGTWSAGSDVDLYSFGDKRHASSVAPSLYKIIRQNYSIKASAASPVMASAIVCDKNDPDKTLQKLQFALDVAPTAAAVVYPHDFTASQILYDGNTFWGSKGFKYYVQTGVNMVTSPDKLLPSRLSKYADVKDCATLRTEPVERRLEEIALVGEASWAVPDVFGNLVQASYGAVPIVLAGWGDVVFRSAMPWLQHMTGLNANLADPITHWSSPMNRGASAVFGLHDNLAFDIGLDKSALTFVNNWHNYMPAPVLQGKGNMQTCTVDGASMQAHEVCSGPSL